MSELNLKEEFNRAGTTEGLYHLRGGEVGYTFAVDMSDEGFDLRYEHGWYCPYRWDGTQVRAGYLVSPDGASEEVVGDHERDIIKFEPVPWRDGYRAGFHP